MWLGGHRRSEQPRAISFLLSLRLSLFSHPESEWLNNSGNSSDVKVIDRQCVDTSAGFSVQPARLFSFLFPSPRVRGGERDATVSWVI